MILKARQVHGYILSVQAFVRMIPNYLRYHRMRRGIILLQQRFRMIQRYHQLLIHQAFLQQQQQLFYQQQCETAARCLQRNVKACLYNKQMAPFVLFCCVYYRNEEDDRNWSALIIQKRYRGWIIRHRNYQKKLQSILWQMSGLKIQTFWRCYYQYKMVFPPQLIYYRRIQTIGQILFHRSLPKLRLGRLYIRKIQRWYRRHHLRHFR